VLALIAAGRSNTEIARELVLSNATIKSHINHIFAKIGARSPRPSRPLRLRPRPGLS
jgi:DNA-binding NarL/FixJ family response regulator